MKISTILQASLISWLLWLLIMFLVAGCSSQPNKLAPEPPYIAQRPGFSETFLFDPAPSASGIVVMRKAPSVEVTDSGYLRDLEAE